MNQHKIDVFNEIASQAISDPYIKRWLSDKILKIKSVGNPNMLFATHIFFADELNIRANHPIKNYTIPIAASAPI